MRKTFIPSLIFILFVTSCNASEEKTNAQILKAREQATKIIELAKAADNEKLAKEIRPADESKVKRHAATKEKVVRLFKDIDLNKVKFGKSFHYPDKNLIIVRLEEPIRMDLEFYFEESSGQPPRLQALHP